MIAAIDVHYLDDASAMAGAVVFSDFPDAKGFRTYIKVISVIEDYVPGCFFRRELPCILAILEIIEEEIDTVIIDGYVNLGDKPGLGLHLWEALGGRKKVIGVAKKYFRGSDAVNVFRGNSRRPRRNRSCQTDHYQHNGGN
jgi:deoxyribonuclease V